MSNTLATTPPQSGGLPAIDTEPQAGSAPAPTPSPSTTPKTTLEKLRDIIQQIPIPQVSWLPEYEVAFGENPTLCDGTPLQTFLIANVVAYDFFPDNTKEHSKLRNSLRRAFATMSDYGETTDLPPSVFKKLNPDKACCLLRALEEALQPGNQRSEKNTAFWLGKAADGLAETLSKLRPESLIPIANYEMESEVRSKNPKYSLSYYRGAGSYRAFDGSVEQAPNVELFALGELWRRATNDNLILNEVQTRIAKLPEWKTLESLGRSLPKETEFSNITIEQNRKTGELRISLEMHGNTVARVAGHEKTTDNGRIVINCPSSQTPEINNNRIREILELFRRDTGTTTPLLERPLIKALLKTGESCNRLNCGLSAGIEIENITIDGDASWINFSGAKFKNIAFVNTSASNALFHGATFDHATFHNFTGEHAQFGSAPIQDKPDAPAAMFTNSCRFVESLTIDGSMSTGTNNCVMANFENCQLNDTQMSADLRAANLRGITHDAFEGARAAIEALDSGSGNGVPAGTMKLWEGAMISSGGDTYNTKFDKETSDMFSRFAEEATAIPPLTTTIVKGLIESLHKTAALPSLPTSDNSSCEEVIEPHTNQGFRLEIVPNGSEIEILLSTISKLRVSKDPLALKEYEDPAIFKNADDAIEEILRRRRRILS